MKIDDPRILRELVAAQLRVDVRRIVPTSMLLPPMKRVVDRLMELVKMEEENETSGEV